MAHTDNSLFFALTPKGPQSIQDVQTAAAQLDGQDLLNQQGRMQLKDLVQRQADDQAVRQAFAGNLNSDGTVNRQGVIGQLGQTNPMAGMKLQHQWTQDDALSMKARREARSADIESSLKEADLVSQVAGTVRDQASYENGLKYLRSKNMNVDHMPAQYDPGLVAQYHGFALKAKDRLEQEYKRLELDRKDEAEQWQIQAVQGGFALYNKKTGEIKRAPGEFKPMDPAAVRVNMGGMLNNFDPSQPLSAALESQAQFSFKTGNRLTPSSRNPQAWMTNARADYLAQQAGTDMGSQKIQFKTKEDAQKYFTTGAGAQAFRQQETILHHADVFLNIANALENGDIQLANKIGNALGANFGSDRATNYKIAGKILSAEVGKYLAGSQSGEQERRELSELIPSFSSPAQMRNGLQTLKNLVEGQRKSWQAQRDTAMSGRVPFSSRENPAQANPQWGQFRAVGNPDTSTIGKNPRFPSAVWFGKGSPSGAGWYVKEGSMIRRVE